MKPDKKRKFVCPACGENLVLRHISSTSKITIVHNVMKPCLECGNMFLPSNMNFGKQKFCCNTPCGDRFRNRLKRSRQKSVTGRSPNSGSFWDGGGNRKMS